MAKPKMDETEEPLDSPKYHNILDDKALEVCAAIGIVVNQEGKEVSPTYKIIRKALQDVHQNAVLINKRLREQEQIALEKDALEVAERNAVSN